MSFDHDAFSRRHLREWYDSGSVPNNWTFETLLAFDEWVTDNQTELPQHASWPQLARQFESETGQ